VVDFGLPSGVWQPIECSDENCRTLPKETGRRVEILNSSRSATDFTALPSTLIPPPQAFPRMRHQGVLTRRLGQVTIGENY
jgi:hypothetical protein